MPALDVIGRDVIIDMQVDGDWFPIMCAKVNQFDLEQDEIETTNRNSGPNREYVPGMANSTVGVTGITRVTNTDNRVNIVYLLQQSVRRLVHNLRMRMTDQVLPTPNTSVISFSAFIRNTNVTNDRTLLSNSSMTWRVTGGISFSSVIPGPVEPECETQDPLYIDTVVSETSVSHASLEADNVVILQVNREGIQYNATNGTPVGRQFKFTGGSGNGIIEFDPNIPFESGEVIYVLYKIEP